MSTYVGGTRMRLISDSVYFMIRDALTALGWFDNGRHHAPIQMLRGEVPWDEPVQVNTLVVGDVNVTGDDAEMGSNLTEDRWTVFVDFYAEDDSVGKHMAGDVRDILRGKMPSVGRGRPIVTVLDYASGTMPAPELFDVEVEFVVLDRAHNAPKPWMRYWYSVRCDLIDLYGDELDG